MSRRVTVMAMVLVAGVGLVSLGCGAKAEPQPEPALIGPDFFAAVAIGSGIGFAYRNGE